MAKELPFFKFFPAEWLKGDITICSMAAQGLFSNICTFYWMKDCNMSSTNVQQRFSKHGTELKELFDNGIIKQDDDGNIIIDFLDEQMSEFAKLSEKRSKAGTISAQKRKGNKCATSVEQVSNDKEKDIEKIKNKINIPFDDFWDLYDKKVARAKCIPKWNRLTDDEREKIMNTLPTFLSTIKDKQFQPNPETYFNARRWEDEIHGKDKKPTQKDPSFYITYEDMRK